MVGARMMDKCFCVGIRGSVSELKAILDDSSSQYIKEVFVGGPPDIGNSGRFKTYPTDMETLSKMVEMAHDRGIDVDVVLNCSCIGKNDVDKDYMDKFRVFVGELEKIKMDWITVSHPALIKTIVDCRKDLKVNVSLYADVTHPLVAKEFQMMGADRITLPQTVNRNLKLIRRIKEYIDIELELFVNSKCLNSGFCPYSIAHRNFKSHQKILTPDLWDSFADPYTSFCDCRRKESPIDLVFTPTIRPEDIHLYEDIGIRLFKIATRQDTPERVIELVGSYGSRHYDGPFGGLWTVSRNMDTLHNRELDGLFEKVKDMDEEHQFEYYKGFINNLCSQVHADR